MNIFATVKPEDLAGITQIGMITEQNLRKNLKDIGEKIEGRLYDHLKKKKNLTLIPFTTTMGNYDPDYLNWYMVIDKEAGVLTIVYRGAWSPYGQSQET